jgi:hypothetical protein
VDGSTILLRVYGIFYTIIIHPSKIIVHTHSTVTFSFSIVHTKVGSY